jgi:hypothetical protein
MAFSNILNIPDVPESLDLGLMDYASLSGHMSTPMTSFYGSLLSPSSISPSVMTTPATSSRSEGHETVAYIWLLHQSQLREKELSKELDSLK